MTYYSMTGLGNLLFNAADIRIIKRKLEARNGWIERRDASCFLGVGDSVLSKWIRAALLRPVSTTRDAQYFEKRDIDEFYDLYIFSDQAAKFLGVGELERISDQLMA